MMVVHKASGELEHGHVSDLAGILRRGDLLVVNESRVIPARLFGRRADTGGRVEILLIEGNGQKVDGTDYVEEWDAFYRASGRPRAGTVILIAGGDLRVEVVTVGNDGKVGVRLTAHKPLEKVIEEAGFAPVPPYIKRPAERTSQTDHDKERYQTIYARNPGSIAAPTAGLHFTADLLAELESHGIRRAAITLHVGPGTFKPVKTELVSDHVMESERYEVGKEAAEEIGSVRAAGGRLVAVGSTTVRVLESVTGEHGSVEPSCGRTSLFIYPPYKFKMTDVMMTNFHLPVSSLIMMVSAFAGRELIMKAYAEAIARKYRFYSYGDCMLIL